MESEKRQSVDGLIDSVSYEEWTNESVMKPKLEAERKEYEKHQVVINQINKEIQSGN